jgi:hypothetical protein
MNTLAEGCLHELCILLLKAGILKATAESQTCCAAKLQQVAHALHRLLCQQAVTRATGPVRFRQFTAVYKFSPVPRNFVDSQSGVQVRFLLAFTLALGDSSHHTSSVGSHPGTNQPKTW